MLVSPTLVGIAQAAPVNNLPPEVVGTGIIGERLLCGAGSWVGSVSEFHFEWIRDGSPASSGVGHIITRADEGHTLWCLVTAEANGEIGQAESLNSVQVEGTRARPPEPVAAPVLSGRPAVGQSLSCSNGGWSGGSLTFTYAWVRDPGPEEGTIEGATASTYTVSSKDQGHTLACLVTAHNSAGTASAVSNALSISGTKPAPVSIPRVLGAEPAAVGEMLSCYAGSWNGSPRPTLTYEWLREGVTIAAADGSSYTVDAADELHRISCRVTGRNSSGSAEAVSSNTIKIRGAKPQNTRAPSVIGEPKVGGKLICEGGSWSGTPTPTLSYVWVRDLGLFGQQTVGSSSEYTLVEEDAGHALSCQVSATNSEGEASQSSEPRVVPNGSGTAPENVVPPTVSGEEAVGATLTCGAGSWSGSPEPVLTYRWLRDGSPIPGETRSSYQVRAEDQAHTLSCRVTAINSAGSAPRESSNSKQIPGVAPKGLEAPRVIGAAEVDETLTCLRGRWSGAPAPSLAVQWLRNGSPIAGASQPEYAIRGEDRGTSLSCRVIASNVVGLAEATSAGVQVAGDQPIAEARPEIIGRTAVGDLLTCLPGSWRAHPAPTFTYQWLLEGSEIPLATGDTYTVLAGDRGFSLSCRVSAANDVGSGTAYSEAVHVAGSKPEITETVPLSGDPAVGSSLKCGPGSWSGRPPPVLSYQWLRDGTSVAGASGATYTVELVDQGHSLSCRVFASNTEGKGEATSASVAVPRPIILQGAPALTPPELALQAPTRAEILGRLGAQLARAQHRAHIASIRRRGSYAFSLAAPIAGKLELVWYLASSGAHRAGNGKQLVVALGSANYEAAGTKIVKLRLTPAGRRLIETSFSLQLTLRAVFLRPQKPSLLWSKTVSLDY
jgi:hypothetical protein